MKDFCLYHYIGIVVVALVGLGTDTTDNSATDPCVYGKNVDRDFWLDVVNRLNQDGYTEFHISDYAFAIEALQAWAPFEDTRAFWNPLATTWDTEDGNWTNFNSVGVKSYIRRSSGVKGTTATLSEHNKANPHMSAIRKMFARQDFDKTGIRKALNKHSGPDGAYASGVINKWKDLYDNWSSTAITSNFNGKVVDVRGRPLGASAS